MLLHGPKSGGQQPKVYILVLREAPLSTKNNDDGNDGWLLRAWKIIHHSILGRNTPQSLVSLFDSKFMIKTFENNSIDVQQDDQKSLDVCIPVVIDLLNAV